MKCKFCGKKTKKVLADVTRKEDGKVAENVPVKHCFECNATFLNLEVITYE